MNEPAKPITTWSDVEDKASDWSQAVDDEGDLKVLINTFVWQHAPAAMPLGKAEELACKVFEEFIKARADYPEAE
jgi:hypothetical protein